jgi:hypothetical protein
MIDYSLAESPDDNIVLEILDTNGNLVRAFTSGLPDVQLEGLPFDTLKEKLKRVGGPELTSKPGMNRFFWDMRHAGPWSRREGRGGRGGPVVAPGIYRVNLIIGNWSHSEPFRILIDPRVAEDGITQADLVAQESLSLKVRDKMSMANGLVERIRKARESEGINRKNKQSLTVLYEKLVTASGPYPQPMFVDQLSYLFSMLNQADQKPGRDAYVRFDELNQELSAYMAEVDKILGDK